VHSSDETLVEKWKSKRDADAFAAIVSRHSSMVYGTCLRILRNVAAAEDVTQECFIELASTRTRIKSSLSGWLHRAAVHRSLNRLRTDKRRTDREREYSMQAEPSHEPDWNDIQGYVDEAMARLPSRLQDPLVAHFFEGQTYDDIASAMGIPRSTVASRVRRAVELVRKSLKKKGLLVSVIGLTTALTQHTAEALPHSVRASLARLAIAGTSGQSAVSMTTALATLGGAIMAKKALVAVGALAVVLLTWHTLSKQEEYKPREAEPEASTGISGYAVREDYTTAADHKPLEQSTQEPNKTAEPAETVALSTDVKAEHCEITDPSSYCSISGKIVDEAGVAIAGARVLVMAQGVEQDETVDTKGYWTGLLKRHHHFSATSDVNGEYTVSGIRFRGWAYVGAFAEGYTVRRSVRVALNEGDFLQDVDVILVIADTLTGRVLAQNDSPVSDAIVRPAVSGGRPTAIAYTDTDGLFTLSARSYSDLRYLTVSSPSQGAATFSDIPVRSDQIVELRMPGTAVLKGRVTWSDQTPATGLSVRLMGNLDFAGNTLTGNDYWSPVNEEGYYKIEGIDVGHRYEVAACTSYTTRYSQEYLGHLEANKETIWNTVIDEQIVVFGHVYGLETGKPIDVADIVSVHAVRDEATDASLPGATVQDDGSYLLELPGIPGIYLICPVYRPFTYHGLEHLGKEIYLTSGEQHKVDLFVPEPWSIGIRVVDENGEPVAGADVRREGSGLSWPLGMTDGEGRFRYSGLTPTIGENISGDGWLVVSHPGYCEQESKHYRGQPRDVFPEETIVLYRSSGVSGIALDPEGYPLDDCTLTITMHYGSDREKVVKLLTNKDGVFRETECLPATTGSLDVRARVHRLDSTLSLESVQFFAGEVTDLGEVLFEQWEDL